MTSTAMEKAPEPPSVSDAGDEPHRALLNHVDIVVVVVYFLMVMATGIYSMCRPNRGTVSGFFLAGRGMSWLPVGASLFASNIGSEHFIGLAGSGAAAGIGVGAFEFNAIILIQLLGWIFLPVFLASRVGTLPEFMQKRFGGSRIQVYLAILSLILYIFTKISVNLYSGAIFIQQALRWSLWWSVIGILLVTVVTTVLGGLAAVIYTDTLQFFIMILGSLAVMGKAFYLVGGYSELQERYIQAIPSVTIPNTTCGVPATDSWIMLRDPLNSDMPWPGFILGQTPASIWYWCADQMMVQRALSARSLSHAQGATLFAGYIKILPVFIMVLPGMISRVLYPDEVGCAVPEECKRICDNEISCSNIAYPKLVLNIMPQGIDARAGRAVIMQVTIYIGNRESVIEK
ncbi:Sodium/myo-inositol cotransporter 2 [Amphibalanus amphitrite]|uniref:Sodium/myo-inositol cotransporter 2 n=1 Tax=Amphibalanus amphitrite TaxID=1232801 RepID=A0A6A4X7T3_AMPAM|nr:Sodium/myo-inositol cotransporter 2 [Amphibalanus amphitrite]